MGQQRLGSGHGNTSSGVLITVPPDHSNMHTPRIDIRPLLPPPGFTAADIENRQAADTLRNLLGETSLLGDAQDNGYQSTSATSVGVMLSEAESGADASVLPKPLDTLGDARRVLNLDIPGSGEGTNLDQSSVTDHQGSDRCRIHSVDWVQQSRCNIT